MNNQELIKKYIGTAEFDEGSGFIFGKQSDDTLNIVAEVRGWGAIQNMFTTQEKAQRFQDDMGRYITDAINQKDHTPKEPIDELIEWMEGEFNYCKSVDADSNILNIYEEILEKAKQLKNR